MIEVIRERVHHLNGDNVQKVHRIEKGKRPKFATISELNAYRNAKQMKLQWRMDQTILRRGGTVDEHSTKVSVSFDYKEIPD